MSNTPNHLESTAGTVEVPLTKEERSLSVGSSASSHTLNKEETDQHETTRENALPSSCPPKPTKSFTSRISFACLNLPPSFFSINMGTGITSILLYNFPYPTDWLRYIGIVIFVLNIAVFCLLTAGNIARYVRYKGIFGATLTHPLAGLFWGTLPMGLATIVNMFAFVCVPAWGKRWAQVALGLWWIDAILSIGVNLGMIFAMFTRQTHTAETVSAAWLLPIVSSVVAAASGGIVASAIMPFYTSLAHSTIIVSYVIWGTGVPIACFIMTLWFYRTAVHGIPAAGALPSVLLPLGPCGQGSFGIILLGRTVRDLAYNYNYGMTISPSNSPQSFHFVADAIYAGGLITGLILWGLGLCWYLLAFAMLFDHIRKNRDFLSHTKFSVGLWAITFPIGVFATATNILAEEFESPAFRVIAAFLCVQVTLHWVYVSVMTVYKMANGTIFVAPEVAKFGGEIPYRFRRSPGIHAIQALGCFLVIFASYFAEVGFVGRARRLP